MNPHVLLGCEGVGQADRADHKTAQEFREVHNCKFARATVAPGGPE
jgi:hypothetical protein